MAFDPSVKSTLQMHLHNMGYPHPALHELKLGTEDCLKNITRIFFNEIVDQCFSWNGTPNSYPQLPKHHYLVACVKYNDVPDVLVFAIYTLEQMKKIQQKRGLDSISYIMWRILEIPEKLEKELLNRES